MTPQQLNHYLNTHYNLEELRQLCLELGIDDEQFDSRTKMAFVRELVQYHQRREKLDVLEKEARREATTPLERIGRQFGLDVNAGSCFIRVAIVFSFIGIGLVGFTAFSVLYRPTMGEAEHAATASAISIAATKRAVASQSTLQAEQDRLAEVAAQSALDQQSTANAIQYQAAATMNAVEASLTAQAIATATAQAIPTATPIRIGSAGIFRLWDGIRDQVSSVRVAGGCALLFGSAVSAEDELRVCEDIALLDPNWANTIKRVGADCTGTPGKITVTLYVDGDFIGESVAIEFCE